jgi:hypothetical protein
MANTDRAQFSKMRDADEKAPLYFADRPFLVSRLLARKVPGNAHVACNLDITQRDGRH